MVVGAMVEIVMVDGSNKTEIERPERNNCDER